MILLPYAHERQTVQRLPWITFGLIIVNVFIFLFTYYGGSNIAEFYEKQEELIEYCYTHPHVEIPEEAHQFFHPAQLEQLESLRQAVDFTTMDSFFLQEEQDKLDRLVREIHAIKNKNPYQKYGYVPADPHAVNLVTAMFLHAGWLHLIGNMLFLYLAGCSIEDVWGRPLYIAFYVVSGALASLAHQIQFPESAEPLVGASGAIAGLMGAFMIRLYNTRISFFYMLGIWIRGTFQAPAYIMLPLWLAQQLLYATSDPGGDSGVAFWAHIGGFIFGAGFALAVKYAKVEEKYIAPRIEQKISLAQNPNFLKGMDLSGNGQYAEALIYLNRAVRQDPNNVDAYMEMKRIAEINRDSDAFNKYSPAMIEVLSRNREYDLMLDMYRQHHDSDLHKVLPAKTLYAVASYFEESADYKRAASIYETIGVEYPDDAMAMKSFSKVCRLYLDRLNDRAKGIEYFWKSYNHAATTDQWRFALQEDMKRYGISPVAGAVIAATATAARPQVSDYDPSVTSADVASEINNVVPPSVSFVPPAQHSPVASPKIAESSPPRSAGTTGASLLLPNDRFHTGSGDAWNVVYCSVQKLGLKGLDLQNSSGLTGFLSWKKIQCISAGRIKVLDPHSGKDNQYVLLDLVCLDARTQTVYRIEASRIAFDRLFPRVEQSFEEAFQNFVGIIANNTGAKCIPNRDSCTGPGFLTYPEESRYDARLKERLLNQ